MRTEFTAADIAVIPPDTGEESVAGEAPVSPVNESEVLQKSIKMFQPKPNEKSERNEILQIGNALKLFTKGK